MPWPQFELTEAIEVTLCSGAKQIVDIGALPCFLPGEVRSWRFIDESQPVKGVFVHEGDMWMLRQESKPSRVVYTVLMILGFFAGLAVGLLHA